MSSQPEAMNGSTAAARVIVDELVRCGVTEAVLAPGSRSGPLAFALYDADRARRLRLHVRIDERSAGFLALGLAKVSGRPVPVVTTSGTATANLHPAVLEASEAGVELVVVTADRPAELRGSGANQTVDQTNLYGRAVRAFHEVGPATEQAGQNAYWRSIVCRALASARGVLTNDPGPVHLNVAFREPLTPADGRWLEPLEGRSGGRPWTAVVPAPSPIAPAADDLPARTLVIAGDASATMGAAAVALAESRGWPLVAEPTANARTGPAVLRHGSLLLGMPGFVEAHAPERILVVGRPTLHREVQALLSRAGAGTPIDVVPGRARWADPARTATRVLPAVPVQAGHRPTVDPSWLAAWQAADAAASAAVEKVLADRSARPGSVELAIATALHAALPAGSLLFAGSSLPVRHLAAAVPREGVTVVANRGAAGIDGTVSAAYGSALAWQELGGGPAFALIGDLTFLHDSGGLVAGPDEPRPRLTIVVLDNAGGGIFGLLEQGNEQYRTAFERIFGTPHGVDLAALCGATATAFTRVSTADELVAVATDPRAGFQVVSIRTSREDVRAVSAEISDAVRAVLGESGSGPPADG